jgi:tetratricopeptide (TPR) repeat protein
MTASHRATAGAKELTSLRVPGKNIGMSPMPSYASPISGAAAGTRSRSPLSNNRLAAIYSLLLIAFALWSSCWKGSTAESSTPPAEPSQSEGTNSEQLIRACLQIQQQLQTMQVAIEQNRKEAEEAAARNAEALSNRLQVVQEALSVQRARELEMLENSSQAMQKSNRATLLVAGIFAATCVLSLLILICFQWRIGSTLSAISTALGPMSRGLGPAPEVGALGPGDWRSTGAGPAEQSTLRLLGAIELLDKHIHEFKGAVASGGNGASALPTNRGSSPAGAEPSESARISALLDQAQSLMNADNAGAALACFDEVLALDPKHKEALVRKGAALERQHKLNEAIECYDRAIAADSSMTIAYLHKGGLCNRLERFKEALECYEKALRTHDQRGS